MKLWLAFGCLGIVACGSSGQTTTTMAHPAGHGGQSSGGSGGNGGVGGSLLGGILGGGPSASIGGTSAGGAGNPDSGEPSLDGGSILNMNPTPARVVDYASSARHSRLIFEVDNVVGMAQRPNVATRLVQRFGQILDKPGGIEVVDDQILPTRGADFAWQDSDLADVAMQYNGDPDAETLSIHVVYVDGHYATDTGSSKTLGISWGNLQVVIFKQTIEDGCGGLGLIGPLREQGCEESEFGVLTHEVGHVLGLVDNGLMMVDDHKDPMHPAHDVSTACIMYWAYEGPGFFDVIKTKILNQSQPLTFCQHCLDDINAVK
ncbi:MAG TPA: hypothetical protein VL137_01390 [Polyangiaceae bacterium]|nr:hypothetical protein [Polyangiaceae bacterium]